MTPAENIHETIVRLGEIARKLEAAPVVLPAPAPPRLHVVTVAWADGAEPKDALIMTMWGYQDGIFSRRVLNERYGSVSPAPDELARCRRALVKMAEKDGVTQRASGGWYAPSGWHSDKSTAISDVCEQAEYPITPAEVEAILGEGGAA